MSSDPKPERTPVVDIANLAKATTVDAVVTSTTVTWSSTDDRGANGQSEETR